MSRFRRWLVWGFAFFTALAVTLTALGLPARGTYGWLMRGERIMSLSPDGPASRAGLAPGDRLDKKAPSPDHRNDNPRRRRTRRPHVRRHAHRRPRERGRARAHAARNVARRGVHPRRGIGVGAARRSPGVRIRSVLVLVRVRHRATPRCARLARGAGRRVGRAVRDRRRGRDAAPARRARRFLRALPGGDPGPVRAARRVRLRGRRGRSSSPPRVRSACWPAARVPRKRSSRCVRRALAIYFAGAVVAAVFSSSTACGVSPTTGRRRARVDGGARPAARRSRCPNPRPISTCPASAGGSAAARPARFAYDDRAPRVRRRRCGRGSGRRARIRPGTFRRSPPCSTRRPPR